MRLARAWVIAEKYNAVAELTPDENGRRFEIEIHEGVSEQRMKQAKERGTVRNSRLHCPHCGQSTPMEVVRRGLRLRENDDLVPRPGDVFQERLYCIRRRTTLMLSYNAPTDLACEQKALELLRERFHDWQAKGYLPSRRIEPGYNTNQPIRERGWTHWHHLFTPRQLLVHGLFGVVSFSLDKRMTELNYLVRISLIAESNARFCRWQSQKTKSGGIGVVTPTFSNQALNTVYNYPAKGWIAFDELKPIASDQFFDNSKSLEISVNPKDARDLRIINDLWLTDPPTPTRSTTTN